MSLTPVEVRHLELRRGLFGYRRSSVEKAIDDVADSFEAVWRERAELGERIHVLETEVARHVELETLLRSTLVSAERAAQDMKEQAPPGGGRHRPGGERGRQTPCARRDRREGAASRRDAPHPDDASGCARDRLRRRERSCRGGGGDEPARDSAPRRIAAPASTARATILRACSRPGNRPSRRAEPPGSACGCRPARAARRSSGGSATPGSSAFARHPNGGGRTTRYPSSSRARSVCPPATSGSFQVMHRGTSS